MYFIQGIEVISFQLIVPLRRICETSNNHDQFESKAKILVEKKRDEDGD